MTHCLAQRHFSREDSIHGYNSTNVDIQTYYFSFFSHHGNVHVVLIWKSTAHIWWFHLLTLKILLKFVSGKVFFQVYLISKRNACISTPLAFPCYLWQGMEREGRTSSKRVISVQCRKRAADMQSDGHAEWQKQRIRHTRHRREKRVFPSEWNF